MNSQSGKLGVKKKSSNRREREREKGREHAKFK